MALAERCRLVVVTALLNDWIPLAELLPLLDERIGEVGCSGTVVVVDDGSEDVPDEALFSALRFRNIDRVVVLTLHRNLGNQRAVTVGLAYATEMLSADYFVLMDSDHEDNPADIPALLRECRAHGDRRMVFAARSQRSEGFAFIAFYRIYQRLYKVLTGTSIAFGNFSVMPAKLARRIAHIHELWNHFPAAIIRARIPYATVDAARGTRIHGQSKMNLPALVAHAISGFAVHAETVAVRVLLTVGMLCLLAVVLSIGLLGLKVFTDLPVVGWTSQVLAILMVFIAQIFVSICVLVFMVVMMRMQVTNVPAYEYRKFIRETFVLCGNPSHAAPAFAADD